MDEDAWKLVQTESGDWALIPYTLSSQSFIDDELDGRITNYAHFVELHRLKIKDWE